MPTFYPASTSTDDIKEALGFTEANSVLYLYGTPLPHEFASLDLLRDELYDYKEHPESVGVVELEIKQRVE